MKITDFERGKKYKNPTLPRGTYIYVHDSYCTWSDTGEKVIFGRDDFKRDDWEEVGCINPMMMISKLRKICIDQISDHVDESSTKFASIILKTIETIEGE